jgi:hypothetical protein
MAYSVTTYTGNGATTEYTIPFPYLNAAHLLVYVDNILQTSGVNYSIDQGTNKVVFTTAPANSKPIKIQRVTDRDEADRSVIWENGAGMDQDDLNKADRYLLYIAQEILDQQGVIAVTDVQTQLDGKCSKNANNVTDPATFRTNIDVYSKAEVLQDSRALVHKTADYNATKDDSVILFTLDADAIVRLPLVAGSPPNGKVYTLKRIGGAGLLGINDAADTVLVAPFGTAGTTYTFVYRAETNSYYRIGYDAGS